MGEPTDGAAADGKKQEDPYLAMDYFDALIPRKIKSDEDINEFMDIDTSSDHTLSKFEVAMQSIPIYCSAEDIERHGNGDFLDKYDVPGGLQVAPYGNPFEQQDNYPYLIYHLKLLRQMLNLCRSINGLSDTRIYCAILINQIDVVLDGMEDSYQVLAKENNRRFISITEHALSEAVVSLNSYSKLIRDNNLQSLQTPNYNLESTVSMEKILVGYGELLNSLFKWYEKTNLCEEIFGLRQQYTPFVIPGNQDESLQTKVLFKEAKPTFPNEKLMVVWCSNEKHHSTVKDACELAERMGVKNLLLYHTEDKNLANRKAMYSEEGKPYYHGNLWIPDDLEAIEI